MSTFSAPGKLMIMGEHAVIYGYPSIVTAVSSRLYVSITSSNQSGVQLQTPQVKDSRFIQAALAVSADVFPFELNNLCISTHNDFSSVNGFGSSAAVTISTIAALADYLKHEISLKKIFELGYKAVQKVQGVGSGFDLAAATYGGTLLFRNGGEQIDPLGIGSTPMAFVVAYSGTKANTAEMVDLVKMKRDTNPSKMDALFHAIGDLVVQAKEAMEKGEWETVGSLMNKNQGYLSEIGVSTPPIDRMIKEALKAGAWGAKLSGAGGGDCIICVTPSDKKIDVIQAIEQAGGTYISVTMNELGVHKELDS